MDDDIERRAVTIAAAAGLVTILNGFNTFTFTIGPQNWQVAVLVASFAALVACLVLAVLALAPVTVVRGGVPDKAALVFWATAAFAAGVILVAGSTSASAVVLLSRGESLFG
jgi:hypothetical protein